jgi:predicted metal-binding membrane protein
VLPRRAWLFTVLTFVPAVCWTWIVVLARDMYGPMTGASAWMMTPHWDGPHLLLLWWMWAVMMTAMMLPSAAPMIVLARAAAPAASGTTPTFEAALASGYVVVWAVFSIGATALQWGMSRLLIITPMMEVSSPRAGAVLIAVAGIYQWLPLKQTCLTTCQSPLAFLTTRWRSGVSGAFRMGVEHGVFCVGCCWALMLLLFVGGVMNLAVIAALTALVAFEKLVPLGVYGPRISGLLLLLIAVWLLVSEA